MKFVIFAALFALLIASATFAASCQSVASFTPSCTGGTIVQDTLSGTCRTIKCASGSSSMQALACDKPDGGSAQFFELYKQTTVGTAISKVCLGSTCVGSSGFAKSAAYTCSPPPACTPTTEVCDGVDNNCNGQTDENNVCAPVCTPTTEVCDGRDNNCNGQVDENNVCTNACFTSVKYIPATCTGGSISSDVASGTCRTIICSGKKVMACDKGGFFEMYNQGGSSAIEICLGAGNCIKNNGYDKSGNFPICTSTPPACTPTTEVCDGRDNNCNGQVDENNVCAPVCTPTTEVCDGVDNNCNGQVDENNVCTPSTYPLKTNIVATQFWVGQPPSADTGWSNNYDSAWDVWWMEHYGGFDDPNNRNGWYPAAFTPMENPFYVAIPYTDFGNAGRKSNAFQVVPWANEKAVWGSQESMIKNRWVRVIKGSRTVYAQVENAGPGPTDDWQYVFGNNPQPTTNFGWHAGIDVSPAVRDYLLLGPVDNVSWQWVKASDVPAGPWKNIVTTRQSCWGSTLCP